MARRTDGITKLVSERTGAVTWRARWSFSTGDGTRQWGSKTFKSQSAAKAHLAAQRTSLHDGTYRTPARLTLNAYVETWFPRMDHDWSTSTAYTRRTQWALHIQPRLGNLQLAAISRAHCQRLIDELLDRGMNPWTVRNVYALLRKIMRHAEQDGLIARNPATTPRLPRTATTAPTVWTIAQVQAFLRHTTDHPDHALYSLILTTGIRIGEAIALRWPNVDLERGTVTIVDTLRRTSTGRYDVAIGTKTHQGRTLPLTPGCIAAITAHRKRQQERRQDTCWWDDRDFVFTNTRGTLIDQAGVRHRLARAIEDAGLPRITAHQMRHTVATLLMVNDVHPRAVQGLLGHASVTMTLERYSQITPGLQRSASDRLATLLDTTTTTPKGDQKEG